MAIAAAGFSSFVILMQPLAANAPVTYARDGIQNTIEIIVKTGAVEGGAKL